MSGFLFFIFCYFTDTVSIYILGDTFYVIASGKCDVFVTESRSSKEDGDEHLGKKPAGVLASALSMDADEFRAMEDAGSEMSPLHGGSSPLEKVAMTNNINNINGNGAGLGRIQAKKGTGGGVGKLVRVLGPGDTFGELALMTGGLRTATVVAATTEVLLWEVDRNTFETIIFQATKKKRLR